RQPVTKRDPRAVALAALLVGGGAVGAYHNSRARAPEAGAVQEAAEETDKLDYATVVSVTPVTEKTELYATVLGAEPVHETTTSTTPREAGQDVVVRERL